MRRTAVLTLKRHWKQRKTKTTSQPRLRRWSHSSWRELSMLYRYWIVGSHAVTRSRNMRCHGHETFSWQAIYNCLLRKCFVTSHVLSARTAEEAKYRTNFLFNLLRFSETSELCSSQLLLRGTFFAAVNHNYGDSQRTLKYRNKGNGSKSTNHNWQTWPFDPVEVNFRFLRGPHRWLAATKNFFRSSRWLEQSLHLSENRYTRVFPLNLPGCVGTVGLVKSSNNRQGAICKIKCSDC